MPVTSKERVLGTIDCQPTDHAPLCFLLASELRKRSAGERDFAERQLRLGLDVVVPLPGIGSPFHPDVTTEVRVEEAEPYPLIHKVYHTPRGDLECIVEKAWDWPHGDDIPLLSDFTIPRARKFLVTEEKDLEPLKFLLTDPTAGAIEAFRQQARVAKDLADERGLAVRGGFHRLADTVCWLCGATEFATLGLTQPEFLAETIDVISRHNRKRMQVVLEASPDILVKPDWYGTTFLSPDLFTRFLLPNLKEEVALAHEAGARVCYLATANVMPFLDILKGAGIDALFGVDPIQGGWDLARAKAQCEGSVCLWGGINGYLHIVGGSGDDVEQAVASAMDVLAPGGGFIMAPVDDVRIEPADPSPERTWQRICDNIDRMVHVWQALR